MPGPTISLAAFGESTFRGVGPAAQNQPDNPWQVPILTAQHFGLGLDLAFTKVDNRALAGRSIDEQRQPVTDKYFVGAQQQFPGPLSDEGIAKARGSIAMVNLGINDAYQGKSVATFKSDLDDIVKKLKRTGRFVVLQTPSKIAVNAVYEGGVSPDDGVSFHDRVQQNAQAVREVCANNGVILSDANALPTVLNGNDTLHPNAASYQLMSDDAANQVNAQRGSGWVADVSRMYQATLMYTAVMGRLPEASGLDWWVANLRSGATSWENGVLATSFLNSAEAQALYPPSDAPATFIVKVYDKIFGRAANQDEINYWVNELSGKNRGQVITSMLYGGANYVEAVDPASQIEAGRQSQLLIQNRCYLGMAYAAVGRRDVITNQWLSSITSDPISVLNAASAIGL